MAYELKPLEERERHIIGPDTEILGGKLLARTGVVVDFDENPAIYEAVLELVDRRTAMYKKWGQAIENQKLLGMVDSVVRRCVPFKSKIYTEVLKEEADRQGVDRLTTDHEMGLSRFVGRGGICHQHSLLSGATLRLMQERGELAGNSVGIAIKPIELAPGETAEDQRWHTRVVFTEESGRRYSVDHDTGVARMPQVQP